MGNNTNTNKLSKEAENNLFDACKEANIDLIKKILVENNCSVNYAKVKNGRTLLMKAAYYGKVTVIQFLYGQCFEFDIDFKHNYRDKWGWTALHIAIMRVTNPNRAEVVKALIENGIDKNIRDNWGLSALDWARKKNNRDDDIVTLLSNEEKIQEIIKIKKRKICNSQRRTR